MFQNSIDVVRDWGGDEAISASRSRGSRDLRQSDLGDLWYHSRLFDLVVADWIHVNRLVQVVSTQASQ